ncbi:glutamate ABC transporter substrate-binding protein [Caballeronia sp. DA-9]|uniref:glutamate ABC transporter substrate-binding protein n=1 Tax=Caballeronia sp. DA-9 TaxID=3436237 RepID=UPI003F671FE9
MTDSTWLRKLLSTLAAVLIAVNCAAYAQQSYPPGSTMDKIVKSGKIRIGTKFDQPLFGLRNLSGQPVGFDVDIGTMIAAKLGLKPAQIEWVETVSANRVPFIQQGKVDMVIATLAITDERRKAISFAGPYLIHGQDIMIKKGNPAGIHKPEDMDGKKICVLNGSEGRATLDTRFPKAHVIAFDDFSKCGEAIKNGSVDGAVIGAAVELGYVAKEPDQFELVGKRLTVERSGIGIKKGDVEFCKFIDGALKDAGTAGSYKAAYDGSVGKYLNTPWKLPEFDPCT